MAQKTMEWLQLGVEVARLVCETKTNADLNEAIRERDLYKKEADLLNSQLKDLKRERYTSGNSYKPHVYGNQRDFNREYSQVSRSDFKSGGQDQFSTGRKSFRGPRGRGQNHSTSGTHHSSNVQNNYVQTSGVFSGPVVNGGKTKPGGSSFSVSRGRGTSRGRGRGNTH